MEIIIEKTIEEVRRILTHPDFDEFFVPFERNYHIKRMEVFSFVALFCGLYLVFGEHPQLLCNLIGCAYPVYGSHFIIRSPGSSSAHWLSYWTIFGIVSLLDSCDEEIMSIFQLYYLLKAIFLICLQLPSTNGTSYIYENFIESAIVCFQEWLTDQKIKKKRKATKTIRETEIDLWSNKTQNESPQKLTKEERMLLDEWNEFEEDAEFPTDNFKPIRALFKPLITLPGENPNQYVALCYQHGEPLMGRVWNNNGKISASFSWNGHDICNKFETMQILCEDPERGFDYDWRPYPEAASFEKNKVWHPVHVDGRSKGDISPGVITVDGGKQILGKVDVRNEKSSYGYRGKEYVAVGNDVHNVMVLCRKARPGFKIS